MNLIVGLIILFACVLGGYVMHEGKIGALFQPTELLIIAGGAFGAFFIAHPMSVVKGAFASTMGLLKGSSYTKAKYMELLALMYALFVKIRKDGLIALEADIEEPDSSAIFNEHADVIADHHVRDFICDYFRLMVGGTMNAMEIENLMDVELETHHEDVHRPIGAVQGAADALPAFGIIAAVLGVVITMASIGGPPEELGRNVGAALVGTMLGILLSYGMVGPIGISLNHRAEEQAKYYTCIKTCIIAYLNDVRPGFLELEEHVKQKK